MIGSRVLLTTLLLILLAACEPVGPIPGTRLSGNQEPVPDDWGPFDKWETVQLETLVADKSYSVNLWGVGLGDQYYVASANGVESRWAKRIARNNHVRLRIGESLFELKASIVTKQSERDQVARAFHEKYDMDSSDDLPEVALYRLEASE
jgi:hypothetical protein